MKVAVMVGVLVLITVIGGGLSTAAADDGRRLVDVQLSNGVCDLPLLGQVQQLISLIPGVKVLHVLPFICALGVQLDLGSLDALVQTLLGTLGVQAVYYDPLASLALVDSGSSVTPASEDWDWEMDQSLVADVQGTYGLQGSGVTVAVVDSGIDLKHPEFKNAQDSTRIIAGFNAASDEGGGCNGGPNTGVYKDNNGHGTQMAGIIAAAVNGQGTIGAAPQVNLMAVKVLNKNAQSHLSDFVCGLQWAYNQEVRLVNMSVRFWNDKPLLQRAIQQLYRKGVLMVAAAGNHGSGSDPSCVSGYEGGGVDDGGGDGEEETSCDPSSAEVGYPAKYQSWVIGVAATKYNAKGNPKLTKIADYSNYGPEIAVAAPGGQLNEERILSTRLGGGYVLSSGTSHATALVTGAMALALNQSPNLTYSQARNALQATAWDLGYSGLLQSIKLINALKFVVSLP
jgi:minor extracellular protease Epr